MIFVMQSKAYLTFIHNKSEPNRPRTGTAHKIHLSQLLKWCEEHTCTTTFNTEQELQLNIQRSLMKC